MDTSVQPSGNAFPVALPIVQSVELSELCPDHETLGFSLLQVRFGHRPVQVHRHRGRLLREPRMDILDRLLDGAHARVSTT